MVKKKMKPKGKRGLVAVKRLGRTYKTGEFEKIGEKAAQFYEEKGIPKAKAEKIGKAIAAKVYWDKVKKRKAKKGKRTKK